MKKALLLYPEFPANTYANYKEVCELVGAKYTAAPLGLITLAALLPEDWDIKLVDLNTVKLDINTIDWADLVFIGGMLPQQINFLKLIDTVHSRGKKVVAGGPDPTHQKEIYKNADYLVLGEAEVTINEFLNDIENDVERGIYFSEEKADITKSPLPRYDLLKFDDYLMVGIQFSRGCPFGCEFCDVIELFGRKSRIKTTEQIVNELERIYQLGYRGFIDIVDDNFLGTKKKTKETLLAIKEWSIKRNFPFFYNTQISINIADNDEILELMKDIDFRHVFIGIESVDPKVLQSAHKIQNLKRELAEDIKKIYKYGIEVTGSFIIGFDNETSESVQMITNIIEECNMNLVMVGLLYALPNTQLTRRLISENRMLKNHETLDNTKVNIDQTTSGINFVTLRSRNEIINDYITILNNVYSVKNYFNRCLKLSKILKVNNKHKPPLKTRIKWIKASFKIAYKLGLKPKTAYYFWRNILVLLFTRPSALLTAGNNMALFLHFNKQTKFIIEIMQNSLNQREEKKIPDKMMFA